MEKVCGEIWKNTDRGDRVLIAGPEMRPSRHFPPPPFVPGQTRDDRLRVKWAFLLFFLSCTPVPPPSPKALEQDRRAVEVLFDDIRSAIRLNDPQRIYQSLSSDSRNWFEEIREASFSEKFEYLKERPFFEVMAVLSLRMKQRLEPGGRDDPLSVLQKGVIQSGPVRNSILKSDLGDFRVQGNQARAGLRDAPNTPVFFFSREDSGWKFDLVRSLPLILRGAEGIGRRNAQEIIDQAVYVLEKATGQTVHPDDLYR